MAATGRLPVADDNPAGTDLVEAARCVRDCPTALRVAGSWRSAALPVVPSPPLNVPPPFGGAPNLSSRHTEAIARKRFPQCIRKS
jgi:hypothetical protein